MTSRELEILNIIYRLGGQCSGRKISKEMRVSSDYAFLIAKDLLNRKLIKKTPNNVFILTADGRSLLEQSQGLKKKAPTLIEVSRSLGSAVSPPSFEPEIHFIGRDFVSADPQPTEHNLKKGQTVEVVDAKSIQKSIKRLIFASRKGRKLIKD